MGKFFVIRKEDQDFPENQSFWDEVDYLRQLQAWPEVEVAKEKNCIEKIFYKKVIQSLPELAEIRPGLCDERHRVNDSKKILTIRTRPLQSNRLNDKYPEELEPGSEIKEKRRFEIIVLFKAVMQLLKLGF